MSSHHIQGDSMGQVHHRIPETQVRMSNLALFYSLHSLMASGSLRNKSHLTDESLRDLDSHFLRINDFYVVVMPSILYRSSGDIGYHKLHSTRNISKNIESIHSVSIIGCRTRWKNGCVRYVQQGCSVSTIFASDAFHPERVGSKCSTRRSCKGSSIIVRQVELKDECGTLLNGEIPCSKCHRQSPPVMSPTLLSLRHI